MPTQTADRYSTARPATMKGQCASVTQGFLYAPFGEIVSEYQGIAPSSALPKYAFNAKELDEESGMYYYEARYYQPPTFISRDPFFEKYFWMSPYAYCANNPVKYVDPSGKVIRVPPFVNTLKSLNAQEKNIIKYDIRFYTAKSVNSNAKIASAMAKKAYAGEGRKGGKGGKVDAYRHVMWQALNVQKIGEKMTRKWSTAHEYSTPRNELSTDLYMDIHNNDVGIEIGKENPNATPEQLGTIIQSKIESGEMLIIDTTDDGKRVLKKSNGQTIKQSEIRDYETAKKISTKIKNNNSESPY